MLDIKIRKSLRAFSIDAAFSTTSAGITSLFGHSGAGKTSIINMVAGLIPPDEGRVTINDRVLFDSKQSVNIPTEKRRCEYIFQDSRLFPHLTVKSNLTYGMKLVPISDRYVKYDQVVELLGIGHLLARRPFNLSGGEKQRVAIGRALLKSPQFLLMDEPLASLDIARKDELLPFIANLPREFDIPILYVTHSVGEILNLSDRIVLLDSGKVIADGNVQDLMSRMDLQKFIGAFDAGAVMQTTVEKHENSR